jgi:probable rRNA maturation factor
MAQHSCTVVKKRGVAHRIPRALVCRCVQETVKRYARAKQKTGTLTVVFVASSEMRSLNHAYRKVNGPTDVLSFTADDSGSTKNERYLGEVIICPSFITRYAKTPAAFRYEVCHVAVHGTLHLLGFRHEESAQSHERLHKQEEHILYDMGVIPPQ